MVSYHDTGGAMINQLERYFETIDKFGGTITSLIAKGEEIKFERAIGYANYEDAIPNSPEIVMSIGSISKQVTAVGILKLGEQGSLSVSDPITEYFDGIPVEFSQVTIHHLLTHTSGISDVPIDDFEYVPKEKFLDLVFSSPLGFEPGSSYSYSNSGYSLLAMIIESITGEDFRDFVLKRLFLPLGIDNAGWFSDRKWTKENSVTYYLDGENTGGPYSWPGSGTRPYWAILGNGGICLSARSLYVWMHAIFESDFLDSNSRKLMLTPGLENYGYGWVIEQSPLGLMVTHNGGSTLGVNAVAKYYPEKNLYTILMSNLIDNGQGWAFATEDAVEKILAGENIEIPEGIKPLGSNLKPQRLSNGLVISKDRIRRWWIVAPDLESFSELYPHSIPNQDTYVSTAEQWVNALLAGEFQKAFSFTQNKEVTQARIQRFTQLIEYLKQEVGKIHLVKGVAVLPTTSFSEIGVHVQVEGNKKAIRFPVLLNPQASIKGLRVSLSEHPLRWPIARIDENIVAWNVASHYFSYIDIDKRK